MCQLYFKDARAGKLALRAGANLLGGPGRGRMQAGVGGVETTADHA